MWKLILKCNFACFITLSKFIQQFEKSQNVCKRKTIEQQFVVVAKLRATLCKIRQGTAKWILLPTAENALYSDSRYAGCINVTFNKALLLPWSTCSGTTRVAQYIGLPPTRYIFQEQRSIVLISSVTTWLMSQWASYKNKLAKTLREVQQLAHLRAEAVADWISEQVSPSKSLSDKFNNEVINQISTESRGFHRLSVVKLARALVVLVVAISTFVSVNPILRLFRAATAAKLLCKPQRYAYTDCTEAAADHVKVVSAIKRKQKREKYRASHTRNQTLETLETQITLIPQTTKMASRDYNPQQITKFTYKSLRRRLLITDVVKGTTTNCDCCLNDDIKVGIINLWPTATLLSTTAEQVDPDATLTHS